MNVCLKFPYPDLLINFTDACWRISSYPVKNNNSRSFSFLDSSQTIMTTCVNILFCQLSYYLIIALHCLLLICLLLYYFFRFLLLLRMLLIPLNYICFIEHFLLIRKLDCLIRFLRLIKVLQSIKAKNYIFSQDSFMEIIIM